MFGRFTIIVFGLLSIVYCLGIIYASDLLSGYYMLDMYRGLLCEVYLDEVLLLTKFIYVTVVIFIAISMNLDNHRNLAKYLVDKAEKKFLFIVSKVMYQILVILMILLFLWLYMAIYTNYLTPFFIPVEQLMSIFSMMFVQGLIYCLLTNLLMELISNILFGLTPFLLLWFMETNTGPEMIIDNKIISFMYRVIPNVVKVNHEYVLNGNPLDYWLLGSILLLSIFLLFIVKDIK